MKVVSAPAVGKFQWRALELTGICIIVFILSQIFPDFFYGNFVLSRSSVLFQPWTIVTHIFMHADFTHLYFNMFALAVFGSLFEKQAGSRNLLIVFFMGGLASAAADLVFYQSSLGASGAIFAVLGCFAIFRPRSVVWVLGVPMYVLAAFFIWITLDLIGFFSPDNIAHGAHLAGMAYGAIYGLWLRKLHPEQKKEREKPALTEKDLEEWEKRYMGK
ncbi:MAG: rhomboid family intramembrane serine protease [Candidatus Aenigmarchaeota archaeon]|nr:rhomboid family intramembrane serine protease [Candidatus Aenigmarchaeota archaeon]